MIKGLLVPSDALSEADDPVFVYDRARDLIVTVILTFRDTQDVPVVNHEMVYGITKMRKMEAMSFFEKHENIFGEHRHPGCRCAEILLLRDPSSINKKDTLIPCALLDFSRPRWSISNTKMQVFSCVVTFAQIGLPTEIVQEILSYTLAPCKIRASFLRTYIATAYDSVVRLWWRRRDRENEKSVPPEDR